MHITSFKCIYLYHRLLGVLELVGVEDITEQETSGFTALLEIQGCIIFKNTFLTNIGEKMDIKRHTFIQENKNSYESICWFLYIQ